MFKVPIRNVFCMLSYVHDLADFTKGTKMVDGDIVVMDFMARRYLQELNFLYRKGYVREYVTVVEQTDRIAGKILLNESQPLIFNRRASLVCEKDEYSTNNRLNQIVKAILQLLMQHKQVEQQTRIRCFEWLAHFQNVEEIQLTKRHFKDITFHRNNAFYKRIIQMAQLIFEMKLLSHQNGERELLTVELSDAALNQLFEKFLFHFFRMEQQVFRVSVEQMRWNVKGGNQSLLPVMRTDVSLVHKTEPRKMIIDAKFYKQMFQSNFGKESFHSHNLYQLFTYLMHQNDQLLTEGVLIYPQNGQAINEVYRWHENVTLRVMTVDLNADWPEIYARLIGVVHNFSKGLQE